MKQRKKTFPIILIIAIVLFFSVACLLTFTNEKGDEKVFLSRNSTLSKISEKGASINCATPKDWLGGQSNQRFTILSPKPTGSDYVFAPIITIHFYKPEDGFVSAEKYVSYLLNREQIKAIGQTKKIKVAGRESYRFDIEERLPPLEDAGGPGQIMVRNAYAITSWNNGFWVFRSLTAREDFDKYSGVFEYLLKSCR